MASTSSTQEAPEYILPEPNSEVQRLTDNDSVFAYSMKNKRILAPIDLTKPGLKILDSATADGLFLRSIEPLLTPPFTLSGFDIMTKFFPSSAPPHITYAIHNITEKWPVEMHKQYDFVHQRICLLGVEKKVTPRQAVSYLCDLVAPGGWIQLGELDLRQPSFGGQAMFDAFELKRKVFDAVCGFHDIAESMSSWLREEGFEQVTEEPYEIQLGSRCNDAAMRKKSIDATVQSWEALLGAANRFEADVDASTTDRLLERMKAELSENGASYTMQYAYGRRPLGT
ncbi:hypothetical protein EV127DRAFT_415049 [Xylaria flabelliformis]|nr:hypothetical protein EV127DRAFT_415049 [Xylaria flabelliformis]